MMKKLLAIIIIICCGCETVVDLDVPLGSPSFVLNGIINPDSAMVVEISENRSVLDDSEFKFIEGAMVDIYEDDKYLGQLEFDDNRFYTNKDLVPKVGASYKIEVSKEGYDNVTSDAKIPEEFASISGVKIDSVTNRDRKEFRFELEINDPIGEHYYEIAVYGYRKLYEFDEITEEFYQIDSSLVLFGLKTEDLAIDEFQGVGNDSYVLNDKLFEGEKYTVSFQPTFSVSGDLTLQYTTFIFALRNINKDYYLYQRSKALHFWVEDNPFAEPVPVHNNIQNGFGIFAGYNQINQIVRIK